MHLHSNTLKGRNQVYKFLRTGLKSDYDGSRWKVGEWRTVDAPQRECVGLNASQLIPDALGYVRGEILAKVEVKGTIVRSEDKWTCEKMRVIEHWRWTEKKSVKLAIYAAKQVLSLYEKKYPNDRRPREAIEAAQACLDNPSNSAAENAARSAANAARSAANAAWSAAWSAASAAENAASAAASAARSAASAARSAAWSAAWSAASAAASAAENAASAAENAASAAENAAWSAMKRRIHLYALKIAKE